MNFRTNYGKLMGVKGLFKNLQTNFGELMSLWAHYLRMSRCMVKY